MHNFIFLNNISVWGRRVRHDCRDLAAAAAAAAAAASAEFICCLPLAGGGNTSESLGGHRQVMQSVAIRAKHQPKPFWKRFNGMIITHTKKTFDSKLHSTPD